MVALEVAAVVLFGFYVGRAVLERRATEAQIAAMTAEIEKLEHEKDSLGELIEYVATDSFIQQEAREKLNLAAPGESVVVIPDIDSSAANEPQTASGAILGASNVAVWWEYFFDHENFSSQSRTQEIEP